MEDKLNQLVTDVAVIKKSLESFTESLRCPYHEDSLKDHEQRLRKVEDFKSKVIGAIIMANILTGIITAFIIKAIG